MKPLLVYLPVIHSGYIKLFEEYKGETLYILGEEVIQEYPLLEREIRRIDPERAKEAVESFAIFRKVVIADKKSLLSLDGTDIALADELEMKDLAKNYLSKSKVTYVKSFLRWDATKVQSNNPVEVDMTLSKDEFDKSIIARAAKAATNSADWYRQVGAVVVRDKKILISGFNKRQPTPYSAYSDGDPRNWVEPGTDTHLRMTLHAEQDVIAQAARQGVALNGASIYVTTFPCPDCAANIVAAGMSKCFFLEGYAQLEGETILKQAGMEIVKVV